MNDVNASPMEIPAVDRPSRRGGIGTYTLGRAITGTRTTTALPVVRVSTVSTQTEISNPIATATTQAPIQHKGLYRNLDKELAFLAARHKDGMLSHTLHIH